MSGTMMGRHFERGQVLFDLKRYRDAVEAYQAELAVNPNAAIVHAMLAAALINLRKVRDAGSAVRRALELAPDMAYAHFILSFVHQGEGRLSDAEKAIAEATRLEQSAENFHQWARIAEQRRKFPESLAATGQALQLNPHYTPSILLRGKLLAIDGKLDEAHSLYVTALSHNPEDPSVQLALGSFRLRGGDSHAALSLLREARRLDPLNSNDSAAIALAYGSELWPLSVLNRAILRWNNLRPKKLWCFFTILAIILVAGGRLMGSSLERHVPPLYWLLCCVVAANYLVLSFSFDAIATLLGQLALRREFGMRWKSLLLRPFVVFPVAALHAIASFAGFLAAFPGLAITLCFIGASSPLITESLRSGAGRLTGYICVPLLFILFLVCALGGIMIDLSATDTFGLNPTDRRISAFSMIFVPILFALAFFSDSLARRISSMRFRYHPLLVEEPQ